MRWDNIQKCGENHIELMENGARTRINRELVNFTFQLSTCPGFASRTTTARGQPRNSVDLAVDELNFSKRSTPVAVHFILEASCAQVLVRYAEFTRDLALDVTSRFIRVMANMPTGQQAL
ncbi:hypothetical protein Aduo_004819 [Ancylostoma duodenale]